MKRITLALAILASLFVTSSAHAENYALRFDGQNDLVDCGEARDMRQARQSFTIECWFRTESANGEQVLITNRHQDDGADFPSITIRNGHINFCVDEQGVRADVVSQNAVNDNRWHHVAGTINGRTWTLYVDGRRDGATEDNIGMEGSNYNLHFGHHGAWGVYYPGEIDEVRIWSRTLSADEIAENMNVMLSGDEQGLLAYWNFDEGEGQRAADVTGHGNNGTLGANNQRGDDDPQWVASGVPIFGGTITISPDRADFPPVVRGDSRELELTLTNTSEEQGERYAVDFEFTFPNNRPAWLSVEPMDGSVSPGRSLAVTLTANAGNLQPGEYNSIVRFNSNSSNLRQFNIPVSLLVTEGAGRIYGRVTDPATGEPFGGIMVATNRQFSMETDENGHFEFANLPATIYQIRAEAEDYLAYSHEVNLHAGDEIELNIEMLHSVCDPRPDSIDVTMTFDEEFSTDLTIANSGNGPLSWSSVIDFPDELEQEAWGLRQSYQISQIVNDSRIQAVTFADAHFFVAGSADQQKLIYVLNRDCEPEGSFHQLSPSRFGFTSLTWDGELLWGAGERVIYGFTTAGDSITSFASPLPQNTTNAVWDSDLELFWVCNATSQLIACNRNGENQHQFSNRGMRMYGLGYYPEDPDGYNLYVYTNPSENLRVIMKMNTANGDTMRVIELPVDGSRPAGCAVTNLYDPYSWVFMGVGNNGPNDLLSIWHLSANTSWISSSPNSGVIEASESQAISLHFNSTGLTPELDYKTTLRLTHDGVGGSTDIPINLFVTGAGGMTQRTIALATGWNLISTNLTPGGADNFAGVIAPLVEARALTLAKDGHGNFYWPAREFNGIESWNPQNGYWLKLIAPAELHLMGESIAGDAPISLEAGWNTVAYFPRQAVSAVVGLAGLGENLIIARDGRGRFYLPAFNFNDIDRMQEGNGYQIVVHEATDLVYSRGGVASIARRYNEVDEAWLTGIKTTSSMHNILLITDFAEGTRIEALTEEGVVAGRGVVGSGGMAGVTLWGDDPTIADCEGFVNGDLPIFRTEKRGVMGGCVVKRGDLAFRDGGWGVVESQSGSVPLEFGICVAYPNPFNSTTRIAYALPEGADVKVTIHDVSGRQVAELASGWLEAGQHVAVWTAGGASAGLYFCKVVAGSNKATTKILLVK